MSNLYFFKVEDTYMVLDTKDNLAETVCKADYEVLKFISSITEVKECIPCGSKYPKLKILGKDLGSIWDEGIEYEYEYGGDVYDEVDECEIETYRINVRKICLSTLESEKLVIEIPPFVNKLCSEAFTEIDAPRTEVTVICPKLAGSRGDGLKNMFSGITVKRLNLDYFDMSEYYTAEGMFQSSRIQNLKLPDSMNEIQSWESAFYGAELGNLDTTEIDFSNKRASGVFERMVCNLTMQDISEMPTQKLLEMGIFIEDNSLYTDELATPDYVTVNGIQKSVISSKFNYDTRTYAESWEVLGDYGTEVQSREDKLQELRKNAGVDVVEDYFNSEEDENWSDDDYEPYYDNATRGRYDDYSGRSLDDYDNWN